MNQSRKEERKENTKRKWCWVVGFSLIVIVILATWIISIQPQSRITVLHDEFDGEGFRMAGRFGWNIIGISGNSLYVYTVTTNNVTFEITIPFDREIYAINDLLVTANGGVILATNQSYGGLVYFKGEWNNLNIGVAEQINFGCIAMSPDGSTLYMAGANTGVYIYEITEGTLAYLNASNGLLADSVREIHATSNHLLMTTALGFQIYNLMTGQFINQTTLPDSVELLKPNCIEYLETTSEIYLGTDEGLHIYRHTEDELIYLKSLGPVDGLFSAVVNHLDFDVASHKLIVGSWRGICIYDIFDESVERVPETLDYAITGIIHRYRGPICEIHFGTVENGLLRLDIDYTPVVPYDTGYVVAVISGVVTGSVVALITAAIDRHWPKKGK